MIVLVVEIVVLFLFIIGELNRILVLLMLVIVK